MSADEAVGQSLNILLPDHITDQHSTFVEQFAASGLKSKRMAERAPVSAKRKDGTVFPAQVSIVRGQQGTPFAYGAILRDVTDEVAKQKQLEETIAERELLSSAIDASNASIVVADAKQADMPLIYVSDEFERLTGYARSEVLGQNCRFLQGPETDPSAVENLRMALKEKQSVSLVLRNYKKSGAPFWNRLQVSPIMATDGELVGFVGVQFDVTEETLKQQTVAEVQRMEALGSLAGNVAHEINNWVQPTIAARSLLEGQLKPDVTKKTVDFLRQLETSGLHIRNIVASILQFARGDEEPTDLEQLELPVHLNKAIAFVREITPSTVVLNTKIAVDQQAKAKFSELGLTQIITNLVSNACRAMKQKGKISIQLDSAQVDATEAAQFMVAPGPYLRLTVGDTGSGLSDEARNKLFEPFFTTKKIGHGGGLGLSVVQGIVRNWGGYIVASNKAEGGAVFTIMLPHI